jgi:glycosyltransferase involved in cell wall biosynthesis
LVSQYRNPPKIHYILNNLTEREILGLHSLGDCYVSLCKSEGFGLTIFEAFKYGKQVITTGYGGQVDFLGKNYEGLVQYKLGNIPKEMKEFSKYYTDDQQWANPILDHAKDLMISATK